jgi:hypothetical protein
MEFIKFKQKNGKQKLVLTLFIFLSIILSFFTFSLTSAASSFSTSSTSVVKTQYFSPAITNPFGGAYASSLSSSNRGNNQSETLFDMQVFIPPLGCQPYVVRSDLLEEQNVAVFCQLVPLKINPGIDITRIESINIKKQEDNAYVAGVGFHSARAAIKSKSTLTSAPTGDNLGYVVVVLKQQDTENQMPDSVNITLSAVLQYGANSAFGIGESQFYLPVLSDSDFENNYLNYGFFSGVGYLRVEDIDEKSAIISIYSSAGTSNSQFNKVFSERLEIGKTSRDFYISSKTGGQGIRITLRDLSIPEPKAKIKVNGQEFEVYKSGSFYNGKCQLRDLEALGGGSGTAKVYCSGKTFDLEKKFNSIDMVVGGNLKSLTPGEKLEEISNGDSNYYLAYVGEVFYSQPREYYAFIVNISNSDLGSMSSETLKNKFKEISKKIDEKIIVLKKSNLSPSAFKAKLNEINKLDISGFRNGLGINLIYSGQKNNIDVSFSTWKTSNRPIIKIAQDYFDKAFTAFDSLKDNYGKETSYPNPTNSYGEEALWSEYNLAKSLGQEEKAVEVLSRIENEYPESKDNNGLKAREYLSSQNVLGSEGASGYHDSLDAFIELVSVTDPAADEAGVELTPYFDGYSEKKIIKKGDIIYESSDLNKTISLISFSEDKVYINYSCKDIAGNFKKGSLEGTKGKDIAIAECGGRIIINNINLKKVAQVQLTPIVTGRSRETNFTFAIGIEKRPKLFQLTPQEANKKIAELNQRIADLKNITESLGKFIQAEKAACLVTSAYVNIKNLFAGIGGAASARKEVMARWNEKCANVEFQASSNNAKDIEECIANNYDNSIAPEIEITQKTMTSYNDLYAKLSKDQAYKDNNTKLKEQILIDLNNKLNINVQVNCQTANTASCYALNKENINKILNSKSLSDVTYPELAELYFYLNMAQNSSLSNESQRQYQELSYSKLRQIEERTKRNVEVSSLSDQLGGASVDAYGGEKAQEITTNLNTFGEIKKHLTNPSIVSGVSDNTKVKVYSYAGYGSFLAILTPISGRTYGIDNDRFYRISQDANGMTLVNYYGNEAPKMFKFIEGDPQSYKNVCKNCKEMKVFSLEPYKGMPALLPFDEEEGWYVQTKQLVAGLGTGNVKTYQDSGKVNSFWLCNVGKNGLIEQVGYGDDICRRFDLYTGDTLDSFPGLTKEVSKRKVSEAIRTIEEAQSQLANNPTQIIIKQPGGKSLILKVQNSEGDMGSKCTDFMSPDDCQLIFNVCDPVICPNSRCDFGGRYKVDNVIQSGIVGSTLLCLPNFIGFHPNTGVVIPVCLTGINAGLEGWTSILESYRDCLNESVTTNKTVGICDMIYSVYACDFFWRQAAPMAESLIKNLFLTIFGKGEKGGGEYMFVSDAWTNAQKSMQYFQTSYGSNSKLAFGFKDITQTAVAEVCKAPFSATYPDNFKTMLEPESPIQFHAFFEEIPYTDATVPPTSQYSVSYHIYSGNDQGHYYQIYLKSAPTSLGYVGKDSVTVASGYVERGQKVSFKKDFVDVSGFKELCVKIDVSEKCGFKSVSTSAILNYAKEAAVSNEALNPVTTESECIAGGVSAGVLLTPNIQQVVEESINPELYNQGIIRVCSVGNPGTNADQSRWTPVGYCDDKSVGCWLDGNSVKKALQVNGIENDTLSNIQKMNQDALLAQGGYFDDKMGAEQITNFRTVYTKLVELVKDNDVASLDSVSYPSLLKDFNDVDYQGRKLVSLEDDAKILSSKLIFANQKADVNFFKAKVYADLSIKLGKNVTLGIKDTSSSSTVPKTGTSIVVSDKDKQIQALAKMMWSEERSQGDDAMRAAGFVAMNRVGKSKDDGTSSLFPSSIILVLNEANQFKLDDNFDSLNLNSIENASKNKAITIATNIINNKVVDNTLGAKYFVNYANSSKIIPIFNNCSTHISGFNKKVIGSTTMYVYNKYCKEVSDLV